VKRETLEAQINKAVSLLKSVPEPLKSQAFPVVLARLLSAKKGDGTPPESEERPTPAVRRRRIPPQPTRADMLRSLIAQGWFKTPRGIAEVARELRTRGLPIKVTSLPALLLPLVIRGRLKRRVSKEGKKETYAYYL